MFADTRLLSQIQLRHTYDDRIIFTMFRVTESAFRAYEKFTDLRENLRYCNFYDNYSFIVFQDRKLLS